MPRALGERYRPAPVQQILVEPVSVEAAQASVAGPHRALAGRVVRQHLTDQDGLVAPACDGLADQ
jgi:hypothetical protein